MNDLRVETLRIPGSPLGKDNPFPMFTWLEAATAGDDIDESVPVEDRTHMGTHLEQMWFPYQLQDDYDRSRQECRFMAVILENDILRATFLPELGGRLWSLFHKPSGCEMLEVNPFFQPGNVALRNAWFSAGVEWNAWVYGHSPHTCSPLFAARLRTDDGLDVLRMYEWNRARCAPFQMDFYLPEDSHFLFLRVCLANPHDHPTPTYWWSNISVPESPDMRAIAPAEQAFTYEYGGKTSLVPVPHHDGTDVTYPTNFQCAGDYFFRIPDEQRPWIAALDETGRGLIHGSTREMKGRKLFAWGMNPGGRRWQELLSAPGAKFEIQAGLARTQMECPPIPPRSEWNWLEAFGMCETDPTITHGEDWTRACQHVDAWFDERLPLEDLETELSRSRAFADRPPTEILLRGLGWGALENLRRRKAGQEFFCRSGLVFDESSLNEPQEPWRHLLEKGIFPEPNASEPPASWMAQNEWRELLEASLGRPGGDHWLSQLQLGFMHYANGAYEAADNAWTKSVAHCPNLWAYRNLAQSAMAQGDLPRAADLYLQAYALAPDLRPLVIECCHALIDAGRPQRCLEIIESLPSQLRQYPRVRVLEAHAAIETDDLNRAANILTEDFDLFDAREGETILSDLWFAMHEKRIAEAEEIPVNQALRQRVRKDYPPPPNLDFRVTPDNKPDAAGV